MEINIDPNLVSAAARRSQFTLARATTGRGIN
jgi:hypothetical protein